MPSKDEASQATSTQTNEAQSTSAATIRQLEERLHQVQSQLAEQKTTVDLLHVAKEQAEKIIHTIRESLLILTPDLHVMLANDSFYTSFQVRRQETEGRFIYELGNRQWDIPALHTLLDKILPDNQVFNDFEVTHEFEQIGQRTMLLNARRLDHVQFILLAIEDITPRKQAEAALQQAHDRLEVKVQERTRELATTNLELQVEMAQRVQAEAQTRQLAALLTRAEQEERRRISQILHDDLQQQLYGIQMRLMSVLSNAEADTPLAVELQEAYTWLGEAIRLTRQLTIDLSPPVLKHEGLVEALQWLVSQMAALHGLQVNLQIGQPCPRPDEDLRVLLFQMVRELLFNVVKHAGTKHATVELHSGDDETCIITIHDEGVGFDVAAAADKRGKGFGLFSIRERLKLFGGQMDIQSAPSYGTHITIRSPVASRGD